MDNPTATATAKTTAAAEFAQGAFFAADIRDVVSAAELAGQAARMVGEIAALFRGATPADRIVLGELLQRSAQHAADAARYAAESALA